MISLFHFSAKLLLVVLVFCGIFMHQPPLEIEISKNHLPLGSPAHWLGTDRLGRDNFALFSYGMVSTMAIAIPSRILTVIFALFISIFSLFKAKVVEILLAGISSVFLAIPSLLTALVLISLFPSFVGITLLAIVISDWASSYETILAKFRELQGSLYLSVSRSFGAKTWQVFLLHYIPALRTVLVFLFLSGLPSVIMTLSLFSYLGVVVDLFSFGPGLGEQISFSKDYFDKSPTSVLLPIMGIVGLVYLSSPIRKNGNE